MKFERLDDFEPAVNAIPVPPFNLRAIQARSERLTAHSAGARRTLIAAAVLIVVLSSLAAAASYFAHFNVTHRYGAWQLYGPRAVINMHPTQRTLDHIAHAAPYHVVWPAALPKDTTLHMVANMASQLMMLEYGCAGKGMARFTILPNATYVSTSNLRKWVSSLKINPGLDREWQVGQERVRVQTNCLTPTQIQTIQSAMIAKAKPASSSR